MKIRKAKLEDMPRIAELSVEYSKYENHIDKNQKVKSLKEEKEIAINFFKNNEVEWFLLEENKNIVGFVSVSIDRRGKKKRGVFHTVFIEEEYRGRGGGKKLLNYAFDYLKKKGCYLVRSLVFPKNKRALELYKKIGFSIQKMEGFSIQKKI